jgi:hypothetical protein
MPAARNGKVAKEKAETSEPELLFLNLLNWIKSGLCQ